MNDQPLEQERWEQNDIANVSDEENNAAHDVQQRMNHHGVGAAWRNRNIDDNTHDQSLEENSLPELLDDTVLWNNPNNGWSDDTMSEPGIENQVVHHQFDDEGMHFVGDELLSSSDEDSVERGEPNGLMQQQRQAWLAHIRMLCQRRYGIVLTDEEIELFDYDSDETVEFDSGLPISIYAIMQERLRIAETRRRSQQMAILRTFR